MDKHWNLYYIFKIDHEAHPVPELLLLRLKDVQTRFEGGTS